MNAALYPEYEAALDEIQTVNRAMNAEHTALGDDPDHGIEGATGLEVVGRPIDLVPGDVPSDWSQFEDRRIARGSSQDWVPRELLNQQRGPCTVVVQHHAPPPATVKRGAGRFFAGWVPSGLRNPADPVALVTPAAERTSVLLPTLEGQAVVFSAGDAGAVCTEILRGGTSERRCVPVSALRAWMHQQ